MDNFLGERLKSERERLGLDQDQMAKAGGVKKRAYCYYEAGERAPDAKFLEAVAVAGADVQFILTGKPTVHMGEPRAGYVVKALSPRVAALLDNYEHLNQSDQRAIERTASALAKSSEVKPVKGKTK